ncbi:response regulator [Planctomyces bekefii]|uniref:Response regulator n=1 Tax=Planctomyces bekefii TaxID=1653850 RepID=A0A5C6MAC8_9PLAN|nr:response regulator [Planctomyces bekefii]
MKILLVEDNAIMRRMLRAMLDPAIAVVEATNGEEGVAQIKAQSDITLILTDFNMPRMNGVQMVEIVRKECPNFQGKFVFTSSVRDKAIFDKAAELGVSSWLHKPFKKEELTAIVNKFK